MTEFTNFGENLPIKQKVGIDGLIYLMSLAF